MVVIAIDSFSCDVVILTTALNCFKNIHKVLLFVYPDLDENQKKSFPLQKLLRERFLAYDIVLVDGEHAGHVVQDKEKMFPLPQAFVQPSRRVDFAPAAFFDSKFNFATPTQTKPMYIPRTKENTVSSKSIHLMQNILDHHQQQPELGPVFSLFKQCLPSLWPVTEVVVLSKQPFQRIHVLSTNYDIYTRLHLTAPYPPPPPPPPPRGFENHKSAIPKNTSEFTTGRQDDIKNEDSYTFKNTFSF